MIDLKDLKDRRDWALDHHRVWKAQIKLSDAIEGGHWTVKGADNIAEMTDPAIENVYKHALEDKVATAAQVLPRLMVPELEGTRADRAEKNAEKRRQVAQTYWHRSDLRNLARRFYMDFFHSGVQVGVTRSDPGDPFPYFVRLDPAQWYPLSHDTRGVLTAGMLIRQRTVLDLVQELGDNKEAIAELMNGLREAGKKPLDAKDWVEEIIYADATSFATAYAASPIPRQSPQRELISRMEAFRNVPMVWGSPPRNHGLPGCPIRERKRATTNDRYEGALLDVIPLTRKANTIMAAIIDDLEMSVYAPVLLDNVKNPEEWGPGAILRGTGVGTARMERDRPPVNFEAWQTVSGLVDMARRQAQHPGQRSGDPGASVVTGKGINATLGDFNSELSWAQADFEVLVRELTAITAAYDEIWLAGEKEAKGYANGEAYVVTYDPAKLWAGDYRMEVTYGDHSGLDAQQYLIRMATVRNMGSMSRRTFMTKSGLVEDVLAEERDLVIEAIMDQGLGLVLPGMIQSGDFTPVLELIDAIDSDKVTARQAVFDMYRKLSRPIGPEAAPGGAGGEGDMLQFIQSLNNGGIPGNAEGAPVDVGGTLPAPVNRAAIEASPVGGTNT